MARRLLCPKCAAQYEIGADLIPAEGREVECSSCGHVWHEPGQEGAAPRLHRPLNESILSILREEAEREIAARRADASGHSADATAPDPGEPSRSGERGEEAPALRDAPMPEPAAEPAPRPARETAEPPKIEPAREAAVEKLASPPPLPDAAPSEDPAASPDVSPVQSPAPSQHPARAPAPAHARDLPDADRLAATLIAPDRIAVAPLDTPEAPPPPASRGGKAGFWLAIGLCLLLLGLYMAAPHLSDHGRTGAVLAEWRAEADQVRLWLAQAAADWGNRLTATLR